MRNWLCHSHSRPRIPGIRRKLVKLVLSKLFPYRTLKNHGHPLLLLHHIEVLTKVWCHVPLPQIFWIVFIHSVKVPLLVRRCGWGWWGHHCGPGITIHCTVFLGSYRIKIKDIFVFKAMLIKISWWVRQQQKYILLCGICWLLYSSEAHDWSTNLPSLINAVFCSRHCLLEHRKQSNNAIMYVLWQIQNELEIWAWP